jgi:hypothetical protein
MGKARRDDKKARKKNRELEAEARAAQERAQRRRRIIIAAVPIVALAVAAGVYFGLDEPSLAGAALLGGALVWLMVGLGFLGSSVQPRDRHRAGSIDFGNRR